VTLDELQELLSQLGSTPSDDAVGLSALDHGLQCAHLLAQWHPADTELQVAGLVHDIGHRFGPAERHGEVGATLVRPLLGDRVAALVEGHVPAKRYLVATDSTYLARLSADSTATLAVQGGPFTDAEAAAFRDTPHFEVALELRRADEAGKVPGRGVPDLERWLGPLAEVARAAR
jgi:predicted HD phosphohydrolase